MTTINIILLLLVLAALVWMIADLQRLKKNNTGTRTAPPQNARQEVMNSVLSEEFFQAHLQLNETVKGLDQQFHSDLQGVQKKLLASIEGDGKSTLNKELTAYQQAMNEARKDLIAITAETHKQLLTLRDTVRTDAQAAVEQEKKVLMHQFEMHLGDVVVQYIEEVLGEGVDLGAQKEYILKQLDTHKAEMMKDINDEF